MAYVFYSMTKWIGAELFSVLFCRIILSVLQLISWVGEQNLNGCTIGVAEYSGKFLGHVEIQELKNEI